MGEPHSYNFRNIADLALRFLLGMAPLHISRAVRRIHFRTFWKNEAHPLARVPFLDIHQHQCEAWGIFALRLCGDRLGIVIQQSPTSSGALSLLGGVVVWDWVKGQMMLVCTHGSVWRVSETRITY
jgi:hypothetical protein